MELDEWIQSARMIHYSIRLPLRLYVKEEQVLALPAGLENGYAPLSCSGGPGTWPAFSNRPKPQYVIGNTGEHYICYLPDKVYALILGPFYGKNVKKRDLESLLQRQYASVKEREAIKACLMSLPRLSKDNGLYIERLLLKVFASRDTRRAGQAQTIKTSDAREPEESFKPLSYPPELNASRLITGQEESGDSAVLKEINRQEHSAFAYVPLRSLNNPLYRRQGEEKVSDVVRAAIQYADAHLLEPVNVNGIAQGIFVHPSYLSTCFRKEMGERLSVYIRRKRIIEAEKMLREGHETMAAIAASCQFCSQSHFIQVFKKLNGLTPEQFIRKEREMNPQWG